MCSEIKNLLELQDLDSQICKREKSEDSDSIYEVHRAEIAARVGSVSLRHYEALRRKRPGGGWVVPLIEDRCSGCNMVVARNLRCRLRGSGAPCTCESCGSFLYVQESPITPIISAAKKTISPTLRHAEHENDHRKERSIVIEETVKNYIMRLMADTLGDNFRRRWNHSQAVSTISQRRLTLKYSSYSEDQKRWFWGVRHWREWEDSDSLVLIMQDDRKPDFPLAYLVIESQEARNLFAHCSVSKGEKKINMRLYARDGKIKLQEWQSFDVEGRIRHITATECGVLL